MHALVEYPDLIFRGVNMVQRMVLALGCVCAVAALSSCSVTVSHPSTWGSGGSGGNGNGGSRESENAESRSGRSLRDDGDVVMRVATDSEFIWEGHIEEIYYPDYGAAGAQLAKAGAIGDKITAMNLEKAIKAQFKWNHNWPAEKVEDAKLMAMIYYNVEDKRPAPPAIVPVDISTTTTSTSTSVKLSMGYEHSMISADGWETLFAEAGVEVEVSESTTSTTTTTTATPRPTYQVRGRPEGYHCTLAIEVYYLEGEGKNKTLGRAAMVGMAYFCSKRRPNDEKLKQVACDLVDKLHKDAWNQR